MSSYITYSLIALVVFNIYVNIRLLISPLFNRFQKFAQSIIIWIIPLLGGMLVYYLIKDIDRDPPPPKSTSDQNYGNDSIGVQ